MNKEINTIIANLEGCIGMFDYLLTPTESHLLVVYIEELQQENKQLKDNWNYIKKMLKEARQEKFNINGYCGTCTDVDIDFLLNKMQELQGSDSNE